MAENALRDGRVHFRWLTEGCGLTVEAGTLVPKQLSHGWYTLEEAEDNPHSLLTLLSKLIAQGGS